MNGKTRMSLIIGLFATAAIAAAVNAQPQPARIICVDAGASPGGNGATWSTAFTELQGAIDAATPLNFPELDQVWVKTGEFKPLSATDSFLLEAGVLVFGGFAGDEELTPISNTHDPRTFGGDGFPANPTILSGELGDPEEYSDNVEVIVQAPEDNRYILDGFVVTRAKGHALYAPVNRNGTYRNLRVIDNVSINYTSTPDVLIDGSDLPVGAIAGLDQSRMDRSIAMRSPGETFPEATAPTVRPESCKCRG